MIRPAFQGEIQPNIGETVKYSEKNLNMDGWRLLVLSTDKTDDFVTKILTLEQQPFTLNCRGNLFPVIDPQQIF